eukprot:scaffold1171_cov177-Amphora_coffeaeformis.AAC.15
MARMGAISSSVKSNTGSLLGRGNSFGNSYFTVTTSSSPAVPETRHCEHRALFVCVLASEPVNRVPPG